MVKIQCEQAKAAASMIRSLSTAVKNDALAAIITGLRDTKSDLIAANQADYNAGVAAGLSKALLDRLQLTPARFEGMLAGLQTLINLPDPVGVHRTGVTRPNGLHIYQKTVPLGVIGIIYEARPTVTVDAIGLALKSGNALVLRGSRSAHNTNQALVSCVTHVLAACENLKKFENSIQLLSDTSRESVGVFLQQRASITVMIPRGSADLIQRVVTEATMPVIETGAGICHIYIDDSAPLDMACEISINAKVSRPSVCNACETLLIHENWPGLAVLIQALRAHNVRLYGCAGIQAQYPEILPVTNWSHEYLDLAVSLKLVPSVSDAIGHINQYGSQHSDGIISTTYQSIQDFIQGVDTACVLINASTRFTDGGEFGFGTEMGIATQKLHVRGPVGLQHLVSTQYIIEGTGQVR